jgi:hypothetical protein
MAELLPVNLTSSASLLPLSSFRGLSFARLDCLGRRRALRRALERISSRSVPRGRAVPVSGTKCRDWMPILASCGIGKIHWGERTERDWGTYHWGLHYARSRYEVSNVSSVVQTYGFPYAIGLGHSHGLLLKWILSAGMAPHCPKAMMTPLFRITGRIALVDRWVEACCVVLSFQKGAWRMWYLSCLPFRVNVASCLLITYSSTPRQDSEEGHEIFWGRGREPKTLWLPRKFLFQGMWLGCDELNALISYVSRTWAAATGNLTKTDTHFRICLAFTPWRSTWCT